MLLLAYSLVAFGSPMPPRITGLEVLMGCGLLLGGMALSGYVIREIRQQKMAHWCFSLTAALLFLPLCVGLLRENAWPDLARDIFPCIFLLVVPVFLIYSTSCENRAAMRWLITATLLFVGICSAITFFAGVLAWAGSIDKMISGGISYIQAPQTEFYDRQLFLKPHDPAMLFAGVLLSAWGVALMVRSWQGWVPGLILAGMGVSIAYCFMILGLRAYTAFYVLAIMVMCWNLRRESGLYLRLLPVVLLACALFWPQIGAALHLLWIKQQAMGLNGKMDEWRAVADTVFFSPQTALFGIGWGGILANPIYLNETTRYTHSLLSFYLLKSGLLGLAALLSIISILLIQGRRLADKGALAMHSLIWLLSCLPPLLIGVLFEPTYKMLSYGVILTLLVLAGASLKSEENRIDGRK